MIAQLKLKAFIVIIVALLLCALPFTLYPSPAFAQAPSPSSVFPSSNLQPQNPASNFQLPTSISPTSPLYTDLLVHNIFHTFSCLAVGQSVIGQPCLTYQFQKNAQGMMQEIPVLSSTNLSGGTLGAVTGLIAGLYQNPPVRTVDYLASVGKGLGIVKEAQAQGVVGSGANVLSPIINLWQASRNIAYVIMIIIFVVIGMMIIFRQKINPQTVITAQAALPGLVIGLILITFSYFLAGLISDTAFVGVNLVGHYFSAAQPGSNPKLAQDISSDNIGNIFSQFVGMISSGDISSIINSVLNSLDGGVQFWVRLFAGIIGFQTGASLGGPIGSLAGAGFCGAVTGPLAPFCAALSGLAGQFVSGVILGSLAATRPGETFGLVLYFVAMAILIYTMFKLLLRLINSYLTIIFLVISAPFQFLFSSLPGRQGLATDWILNLLANVLAFPAVFAVFYFVAYLWGSDTAPGQFFGITSQLNPTDTQTLPLLGGIDLHFIRILLAFGALIATPTIPDIVIRTISKVSQAGQLIGQEIGAGTRAGQGYAGRVGAVPGQLGGNLTRYTEQFGPKKTIGPGGPTGVQVIGEPSLFDRLRGRTTPTKTPI